MKNIRYLVVFLSSTLSMTPALSGCSSIHQAKSPISAQTRAPFSYRPLNQKDRERLIRAAQSAVGKPKLHVGEKSFRNDCSGTIRAIFRKARLPLGGVIKSQAENDVKAIYRFVKKYGQVIKKDPRPGDLVFFHNTYDRSRNGLMNDALTHVGIVEKVTDQTVHFIHHLGQAIIRSRMNLGQPRSTFDPKDKQRINHVLRRAQGGFKAFTAAELFAGFGRL